MTLLIYFLLALNVLVPAVVVARACFFRNGIEFNHILMFSIGYLFYWIAPVGIGEARLFQDEVKFWYNVFDAITPETLALYLTVTLLCYLSFCFGSFWGWRRQARTQRPRRHIFFDARLMDIFLVFGLIYAAVYAVVLRDQFFHGYLNFIPTVKSTSPRGSFTAASIFLLSLAFLYSTKRAENMTGSPSVRRLLLNRFFICYFLVDFLVFSMGSRLYVISGLVMLLVFWSCYFHRISRKKTAITFLTLIALAGFAGAVRLSGPVDPKFIALGLLEEPLFVGFSLTHFLQANTMELIRFPIFLLGNLLNLVPSALLPNKTSLLLNPGDYGFEYFSPLGGTNSFWSFMINFGVLGTMGFLFLTGWFYSYLRYSDRTLLHRTLYVMLTGWLGFTFFRDDFSIGLVKSMLQFSVIVPIFVVILLQLASIYLRDLRKPAEATGQG